MPFLMTNSPRAQDTVEMLLGSLQTLRKWQMVEHQDNQDKPTECRRCYRI